MLKKYLMRVLLVVIYMVILIEDLIWETGKYLFKKLDLVPLYHTLENKLKTLPPYGALATVLLPGIVLFPAKLSALYLLSHGMIIGGVAVLVSAKIIGTMLLARLFTINKDKLLSISWFKSVHDFILNLRNKAVNWLHSQPFYQTIHSNISSMKAKFKRERTHLLIRARRHVKRVKMKSSE